METYTYISPSRVYLFMPGIVKAMKNGVDHAASGRTTVVHHGLTVISFNNKPLPRRGLIKFVELMILIRSVATPAFSHPIPNSTQRFTLHDDCDCVVHLKTQNGIMHEIYRLYL